MSYRALQRVLGAFAVARNSRDYFAAKRLGEKLKPTDQFLVIDAAILCRRRLEAEGVL